VRERILSNYFRPRQCLSSSLERLRKRGEAGSHSSYSSLLPTLMVVAIRMEGGVRTDFTLPRILFSFFRFKEWRQANRLS
jgi:hypothetical protein